MTTHTPPTPSPSLEPAAASAAGAGRSSPPPAPRRSRPLNPWLKTALEAGPLVVFFIVNNRFGILTGTLVFVIATTAALAVSWLLLRRVPMLPLVSGVFVLGFGGLTVWLEDDLFIKLKPTVVNLSFAAALAFGLATGRNFLKSVFDAAFHLDETGWRRLTARWAVFFVVLAVLNEVVWRTLSTDDWVTFKVFGIMPLTIAFSLAQIPLLLRHQIPAPQEGTAGGETGSGSGQ